jgi:zinc protease
MRNNSPGNDAARDLAGSTRRALGAGLVLLALLSTTLAAGPQIQHWQTEQGVSVLFIAAPELPMVDVRMVFDAGSARDGGQKGLARLTNGLLIEGAGGLAGGHLRERLADLGAQYSFRTGRDSAWVGLRSLSDAELLIPAGEVLATIVAKPDFLPEPFTRERTRQLQALRERGESMRAIAADAFYTRVYRAHPYASPTLGRENSITVLTRTDAELFHARYYAQSNCIVAIIGDLTRGQAEQLAASITSDLPSGDAAPALPALTQRQVEDPADGPGGETHINHDSKQTHVLFGQPGPAYNDPDYFALYVGNHVLGGGGFSSRLMKHIREEQGLAYSANSYFRPLKIGGPFIAGVQTRNESVQASIATLRATINAFIEEGPSEEELEHAKQNIIGGFALRIDSNSKKLGYLMRIGVHGLAADHLDEFPLNVEAITVSDVRNAFRRRLDPAGMSLITVGSQPDVPADMAPAAQQ